jgi:phosphinothricin acetyltransferase
MAFTIRAAQPNDIESVLEIWKHYIENTNIAYELTIPSLDDFKHRYYLCRASKLPYLVTTVDNKIVGYCMYRPFANSLDEAFKYTAVAESWVHPDYLDSSVG